MYVVRNILRLSSSRLIFSEGIFSMSEKKFYDFTAKDIDGTEVSMDKYKGQVVIAVNVASKCGYTDNHYRQLNELLKKYKDQGLRIAAFPCNQFGHQEPSCEVDIKKFVTEKHGFEPDLYAKIDVNGSNAHPIFNYLKHEQHGFLVDAIKWNFTKFLIDRNGKPVKRYAPNVDPKDMVGDIEKALKGEEVK